MESKALRTRRSGVVGWLMAALSVGMAWRLIRYGLNLQMYPDDAYLLNNVVVKSYRELLRPLANTQVAAPVFLWIEKFMYGLWPTDWGVRAWPMAAGLASVGLMWMLAKKVLRGGAAVWVAAALLSVSEAAASYSAHAKPYTTDLLISLIITLLGVEFLRRPGRAWLLATLGLTAALGMWASYTSLFVAGGVGLTLAGVAFRRRKSVPWTAWAGLAVFAGLAMASLALLYAWNLKAGLASESAAKMREFWGKGGAFPPVKHPLKLIWWFIDTHTGLMYAYPQGAKHLACTGQFVLWMLGIRGMWRKGRKWGTAILLAPQGLLLGVAMLGLYPYGDNARISLFLAPAICVFMGRGVVEVGNYLGRMRKIRQGRCSRCRYDVSGNPKARTCPECGWPVGMRYRRGVERGTLAATAVILMAAGIFGIGSELWTRFKREKEPTIRTLLTRVSRECGARGQIVCAGRPGPLAGGGSTKQIFEYYLLTAVKRPIEWGGQVSANGWKAGDKVFVILYTDKDAREAAPGGGESENLASFESATEGRLELVRTRKAAPLYRERGTVSVMEYRVK